MIKLYLLMIFLLILYPVLSGECIPFENFCSECSQETGLCSKCSYDVFLPDEEGGCTIGNKHCSQGKNYCEKCSESDYKCQICEEGYFPDKNGGCSFTENCSISYNGSCKICDKNYILIDLGNKYLDCVSIFSEELLNCKEYTPKGKCIECETNYYLSYGEKKCTNTDNCFSSISGVCNQCVNYYYLDKSDDYKNNYKVRMIAFYIGLGWAIISALSRIYAGAHFLSDVGIGLLLGASSILLVQLVLPLIVKE